MAKSDSNTERPGAGVAWPGISIDHSRLSHTLAGTVRAEIVQIEASLARGARIKDIYPQFVEQGMKGSLKAFAKAIAAVRKSGHAGRQESAAPTPLPKSSAVAETHHASSPPPVTQQSGAPRDAFDVEQFFPPKKSIFDRPAKG